MRYLRSVLLIISALICGVTSVCALEALVLTNSWEILVVKPDGAMWSLKETNGDWYVVRSITDVDFSIITNNEHPVVSYPYATYDTNGDMNVMSEYRIDVNADNSTNFVKDGSAFGINLAYPGSITNLITETGGNLVLESGGQLELR